MKNCLRCLTGELKPLSGGTCWYCSNYAKPVLQCASCGLIIDAGCLKRTEDQIRAQGNRDLSKDFKPGDEEGSSV